MINKTAEAILRGQFDEARENLKNGETLSGTYVDNNRNQIISSVLNAKAFDLVEPLIKNGLIEMDIYEYDNFDRSVFSNIARSFPVDEASLLFLKELMQQFQNINDEVKDQTLLGYCMEQGADPAIIKCMVDAGCRTDFKNNANENFIYQVVNKNMLAPEKSLAYIELLIAEGVDVNARNVVGTTPLMLAVQRNREACLDLLLQNGADANEQDDKGNTAFYFAVAEQQNLAVFEKLSEYATPNFDLVNRDEVALFSEFMRMMRGGEKEIQLLEKLLHAGASFSQTSPYYGKPKSGIDWLAEKNANVLQGVLKLGVIDINAQDDGGNTLLHKICAYNVNYEAEVAKELYRKVKLLLEAGADTNIVNDNDKTPLMLAQEDNLKIKTVELLMQKR